MISLLLFFATLNVRWNLNPPAENVTSYDVYINDSWRGETGSNTFGFGGIDGTVQQCVYVVATNAAGTGPRSNTVCVGGNGSSSSSVSAGLPSAVSGLAVVLQ